MRRMTNVLRLLVLLAAVATAALGGCSRAPEGHTRKSVSVTGTVLEQLHAPPYSYLRIKPVNGGCP